MITEENKQKRQGSFLSPPCSLAINQKHYFLPIYEFFIFVYSVREGKDTIGIITQILLMYGP
jgi:hypothetical protein